MFAGAVVGVAKSDILAKTPPSSVRRGVETSSKYARVAVITFRQQEEAPKPSENDPPY